jgi:hypothetical protein
VRYSLAFLATKSHRKDPGRCRSDILINDAHLGCDTSTGMDLHKLRGMQKPLIQGIERFYVIILSTHLSNHFVGWKNVTSGQWQRGCGFTLVWLRRYENGSDPLSLPRKDRFPRIGQQ